MIVHDITDPYFAEVVRGVEDAASARGYLVITCSSERNAQRESSYVRLLRQMRAAAVIFAGSGLDDPLLNEELPRHIAAMTSAGAAVVHLSPHALGEPEISVDNVGGVAAMVAALVGLGHRQIAFLSGPAALYVARDRLAGYVRGLTNAGIAFDERLVVTSGFTREDGALAVDALLAAGASAVHRDQLRQRPARARRAGAAPGAGNRRPARRIGRRLRRHLGGRDHRAEPLDRAPAAA